MKKSFSLNKKLRRATNKEAAKKKKVNLKWRFVVAPEPTNGVNNAGGRMVFLSYVDNAEIWVGKGDVERKFRKK